VLAPYLVRLSPAKSALTHWWDAPRRFDTARVVFVESESKKVGNVAVPETLMERIRQSPCISLQGPWQKRVQLLLEDYADPGRQPGALCNRLERATVQRG
jgi:tRNA 2-selenouridine synthase